MLPDNTKLMCKYHDGKHNHTLTVSIFKKRFEKEDPVWLDAVLSLLESQGSVALRFATYSLKEGSPMKV